MRLPVTQPDLSLVYVPLSDARRSESGLVWRTAADSPAVHAFLRTAEDQMGERSVPRTAR